MSHVTTNPVPSGAISLVQVMSGDTLARVTSKTTVPPEAQAKIDEWNRIFRWPIVIAAVAPFTSALVPVEFETTTAFVIDLVSWLVFAVDLGVRLSYSWRYIRTGAGLFDLTIVLFTFPWYVLPGWDGTAFLSIFRIVRLITVFITGPTARRLRYLYDKLGTLGIVSAIVVVVASLIVVQVEPPESGFDNLGDAIWWSVVTITTVGYGDVVPNTPGGRFAGLLLLLLGLAALGTVAGVLTSMFRGAAEEEEHPPPDPEVELAEIKRQLAELHTKLDAISDRLGDPKQ